MITVMHWFFSIMLGQFTYLKILNIKKISGRQIVFGITSAAALSAMIYFLQIHLPYLRFALMVLFAGLFAGLIMRTKLDLAITDCWSYYQHNCKRPGHHIVVAFFQKSCYNKSTL